MGRWLNLARELSDCHDNKDNSANSVLNESVEKPIVTNVTIVTPDNAEAEIIAWINSYPPSLPKVQNNCAECGEFISVYDTGWVILGDGVLIHYSGKHGDKCWKAWRHKRRDDAKVQLGGIWK